MTEYTSYAKAGQTMQLQWNECPRDDSDLEIFQSYTIILQQILNNMLKPQKYLLLRQKGPTALNSRCS
jgi:hypothetical protein